MPQLWSAESAAQGGLEVAGPGTSPSPGGPGASGSSIHARLVRPGGWKLCRRFGGGCRDHQDWPPRVRTRCS
eukprot:9166043-Pyramimonas_sp.AAC.1